MSSIFDDIPLAPRDPILGVTEAFNADVRPEKVNLGVGIYSGDDGKVPLLECVRQAEQALFTGVTPRSYLPIDGPPAYQKAVQALVFGPDAAALKEGRVVTVQTLGGTGALRIAADLLRRFNPDAQMWISDPSWENHRALFEAAGFRVNAYPYYDPATHGVDFPAMLEALRGLPARSVVLLHVCCHNPTGVDLDADQWGQVIDAVESRGLLPLLDLAYQGFGSGLDEDATPVRRFVERGLPAIVCNSFSKNFSLYGERIGALSVVTARAEQAAPVLSQLKRLIRTSYSNPPSHGALVVQAVLGDPQLRDLWVQEIGQMRDRIKIMRRRLVEQVAVHAPAAAFDFVQRQNGMFSYSGLSKEAVAKLREDYGIYAVDSGRICVAALNSRNVDYVARAVARQLV